MNSGIIKLFTDEKRTIKVNIEAEIDEIEISAEYISVQVKINEKYYNGLTLFKANIFPIPKEGDLISIYSLQYKHDENLNLRLFIDAKVSKINDTPSNKQHKKNQTDYDFTTKIIINTLKDILNFDKNLMSNIFKVDSEKENYYLIKCIEDNESYFIAKNNDALNYCLNHKGFIYINNFYVQKNNENENIIQLSPLSLIERLSEEELFILLENNEEISKKYLWGKVIEKDKKNKIEKILDKNKNVLKLLKYREDIHLGQYCLFAKYKFDKNNNTINLDKDSFSYFSSQDLFFSNKIKFNHYSVLQFYFLDFKINETNKYNIINIRDNFKIDRGIMEIVIDHHLMNANHKIYPIEIFLKENEFSIGKNFYVKIVQGLLTKINLLANYEGDNAYSYEYLYMFYNETNIYDKYKNIYIDNKEIKINIFDNYDSSNRIRFNIVNIPFQNEVDEIILKTHNVKKDEDKGKKSSCDNSLLVCETFNNDNKSNIYGIFKMREISNNIPLALNSNAFLDFYYNNYGDIYDKVKNARNNDESVKIIEECEKKEITDDLLKINNNLSYYEDITNCQLKTRLGILIIQCFKIDKNEGLSEKLEDLRDIQKHIDIIENNKNKFNNNQILRIFSYLIKRNILESLKTKLVLISDLKHDCYSPYYMANSFNLKEIDEINEYSKLFQGYLQMDSHILYNYIILDISYSLSIEPLFIVKYHLKSNYEGFFFKENLRNDVIAWTENKLNVIVINEYNLFEKSKYKQYSYIQNEIDSKSHAFGISIVFRHESNSHKKKNLKNSLVASPIHYCDNGKIKKLYYKENGQLKGEDGVLIESLITSDQNIILSLAKDFIYSDLFDITLFIGKDFTKLLTKMEEIKNNNKNYFDSLKPRKEGSNESDVGKSYKKDPNNIQINYNEIIRRSLKTGTLEYGDQFYPLDMVKEMVDLAELKGHKEKVPKIFLELEKEMEKQGKK